MQQEELMIGDWVCYSKANKYYTRVNEIRHTEAPLDDQWYIEGMRSDNDKINPNAVEYFAVEILSPIPLTEEILEKNFDSEKVDFEGRHIDTRYTDHNEFREIEITEYNDGMWQVVIDEIEMSDLPTWKMYVCDVHQLQHALKLFGITKDITL